jgi:hypothetical protein
MLRLLAWIDAQSLDRLDEIGLGHVMHRGDHAIGIAVHIGKRHSEFPCQNNTQGPAVSHRRPISATISSRASRSDARIEPYGGVEA